MSSSIRPPGAKPPGPSGLGELSTDRPSAAESARPSERLAEARTEAMRAESPVNVWLSRLSAGEITREQAIDGLVGQALASQGTARLSAAQRSELSEVLRASLLEDPVLLRLLGE